MNLTSLSCIQGHWSRVRGVDGGSTEAASECSGLEPAACVEGRGCGHAAGQGMLLTSSREWEGNGISHDACKDVEVTADVAAPVLISQRWQVSADSVMRQLQPIRPKCV